MIIDGRPEIFPVNHVFDAETGCVLFASNTGTKLRAAVSSDGVAFEADGASDDGSRGWSVLVVGRAEEVDDAATLACYDRLARRRAATASRPTAVSEAV